MQINLGAKRKGLSFYTADGFGLEENPRRFILFDPLRVEGRGASALDSLRLEKLFYQPG